MYIKVAVVDDHEVIREGVGSIIDKYSENIMIVKNASCAYEILEFAGNKKADIYLMDIVLPDLDGIITIRKLLKLDSNAKIIVVTMFDDPELIEEVFLSGAKGFFLKSDPIKQIIYAINEVYKGRYYISPGISGPIVDRLILHSVKKNKSVFKLTVREKEVLQSICNGFSDKEIAVVLGISINTVHVHKNNIMKKLNIHSVAGLVRYAIKTKLIRI